MSRVQELQRLAKLHAAGALTDEEFAQQKARMLGQTEPSDTSTAGDQQSTERLDSDAKSLDAPIKVAPQTTAIPTTPPAPQLEEVARLDTEQLKKLGELKASGLLSDEEFQQQKAILLSTARSGQGAQTSTTQQSPNQEIRKPAIKHDDLDDDFGTSHESFDLSALRSPLGIMTILCLVSMFLPWVKYGKGVSGWGIADIGKFDSGILYLIYLFPLVMVYIGFYLVKDPAKRLGPVYFGGLLPLCFPAELFFFMFETEAEHLGFGTKLDFIFKMFKELASYGFWLALMAGISVFLLGRAADERQKQEALFDEL